MTTGLSFADVATVAVIVAITTAVVRRSYGVGVDRIVKGIEKALTGDHDVRVGLHRNDAVGRLSQAVDLLLAQRAAESLEADGVLEEAIIKERRVEELIDAGLAIVSTNDEERIVEETMTALLRITPSERGYFLFDGASRESDGQRLATLPQETPIPRFLTWAMDERKADYTNNVAYEDRCDEGWDDNGKRGEALVAPLFIEGKVRGGVFLVGRGVGYGPDDVYAAEVLLRYAALPLSASQLT